MRTAWIRRRVHDPEQALRDHSGAEPTWIIEDLSELPDLL
jgi:FMN phosphatase YigB (HAD superfamily)